MSDGIESADAALPAESSPYPKPAVAWYTVGILLIAYTIAFIDRTILALMVGPIQRDLGISDTAMGLLHGFAFAFFYCLLGIPIARLADRMSRRWIIIVGMSLWSLMTALCGIAKNFTQLFLARIGVGVGEAALSPAAYSMIADLFPPTRLGRALGVYSSGVFFGAGLAFIIGGSVVAAVQTMDVINLPLVGDVRSWQAVFFAVGLPGVFFALCLLTTPEPARRQIFSKGSPVPANRNLTRLMPYLLENRGVIAGHFLGFSLLGIVFNGFIAWAPTQLIREFSVSIGEVGTALGIGIFVFGGSGIIVGGLVADRLARKGRQDANLLAGALGGLGLIPTSILAPIMPSYATAVAMYGLFFFFASFPFGAAAAALQVMAPNDLRARLSAIYLLVLNLLGIGFGPLIIAAISDYALGADSPIGVAMTITAAVMAPLGTLILFLTCKHYALLIRSR